MSDYSVITNFAAKDSLPKGDAGKVLRGAEIGGEFNAIEVSLQTKQDRPSSGNGNLVEVGANPGGGLEFKASTIPTLSVVTLGGSQTLTGKTLDNPVINGGTIDGATLNSPVMNNVSLQSPQITDPVLNGTPVFTTQSKMAFARELGLMGTIGAKSTLNANWNITSSAWVDIPFSTTTSFGVSRFNEVAAPGGVITVPEGCRWVEITGKVVVANGATNYRVLLGSTPLLWGFVGSSNTEQEDIEIHTTLSPTVQGDVIKLQVDETQGNTIISTKTSLRVIFH